MELNPNQNSFSEQSTGLPDCENKPLKKVWERPEVVLISKDYITSKKSTDTHEAGIYGPS